MWFFLYNRNTLFYGKMGGGPPYRKGVSRMVSVETTLIIMIAFSSLIVSVIAVTQKNNPSYRPAIVRIRLFLILHTKPPHFLRYLCLKEVGNSRSPYFIICFIIFIIPLFNNVFN